MAPRRAVLVILGALAAASLLHAASATADDAAPPGRSVSAADLPGVVVAPSSLPDVDGAAAVFPRPRARRLGPEDRGPTTRSVIVIPDAPAPSSSNSKHATAGAPPPPAACRDDGWDFGSFALGFAFCGLLFVFLDEKGIRVVFVRYEEAATDARGGDGAGEAELTGTAACAPAA